jgi:hypothetical protein
MTAILTEDDLVHTVCHCDPDLALCGTDVTGEPWDDDGEDCAECERLDQLDELAGRSDLQCFRCAPIMVTAP